MKGAFDRAMSTLGNLTRLNSRRISPDERGPDSGHELHCVQNVTDPLSTYEHSMEADDFLFRKNNVLLKCPKEATKDMPNPVGAVCHTDECMVHEDMPCTCTCVPVNDSMDKNSLVPGFFFVTTRGSDFGSTLILNWAPNSSMVTPDVCSFEGLSRNPSERNYCSSISMDLSSMEMIRIFYRMDDGGFIMSGELVIKSKEQEFKVFYFKNGGLNDLVHVFRSWKYFSHTYHRDIHCHTFTIYSPKLSLLELHPLEGKLTSILTEEMWSSLNDGEGRVSDTDYLNKVIFFQGLNSSLRKEVWPFLLGVYSFQRTSRERKELKLKYSDQYSIINKDRYICNEYCGNQTKTAYCGQTYYCVHPKNLSMRTEGLQAEYEAQKSQIEKDVVRTDRSNPYYKGENNEHLILLLNLVLNFLHHKPEIKYTQGMTDLLAPLLSVIDDEIEAFWSFTNLMESNSICRPGKSEMSIKHQLDMLRSLIEMLLPSFYDYLILVDGGISLMFCHRWLLVFLKREFNESDILFVWETCWSILLDTELFHLFICVAIMAVYGQRAVEKQMNIDELMVYFNTLSRHMPKDVILCQARGYLHQFCISKQVNCVLYGVMTEQFWKKENSPNLFCSICSGFGSCSRTGFLSDKEIVC